MIAFVLTIMLLDYGNYVSCRSSAPSQVSVQSRVGGTEAGENLQLEDAPKMPAIIRVSCRPKYLTLARDLAFVAHLFNTWPCTNKKPKYYGAVQDVDAKGEREARVFTLWLTLLSVEPGVFDLSRTD